MRTRFIIAVTLAAIAVASGCGGATINTTPGPSGTPTTQVSTAAFNHTINKMVVLYAQADTNCTRALVSGITYTRFGTLQTRAFRELKAAGRIAPADDGSRQWQLATIYAVRVYKEFRFTEQTANCLMSGNHVAAAANHSNAVLWSNRAMAALRAYSSYAKELSRGPLAPSATPSATE